MYSPFEINRMLKNMIILIDTREQETPQFKKRVDDLGCPVERSKLEYGDYTAKTILPNGEVYSLADKVVIERKMNLDELCMCYTSSRKRFEREFERAISDNAKTVLLVENADWEKAFNGNYRSQFNSNSLIASMLAWAERYNVHNYFCNPAETGKLIYKILYYALKERLENEVQNESVS